MSNVRKPRHRFRHYRLTIGKREAHRWCVHCGSVAQVCEFDDVSLVEGPHMIKPGNFRLVRMIDPYERGDECAPKRIARRVRRRMRRV